MTRYSGEPIDRAENESRNSHYRIQINKNLFLDAEDERHFEGRFTNDGKRAGKGVNVRFVADYTTNICSITDYKWIRICAISYQGY